MLKRKGEADKILKRHLRVISQYLYTTNKDNYGSFQSIVVLKVPNKSYLLECLENKLNRKEWG